MDKLKNESFDWAIEHLMRFGDTDIFPIPFEYRVIKNSWEKVREYLSKTDLDNHALGAYRRVVVPKGTSGFRVAIQLDPLDSIIYAAMTYEAAPLIEGSRIEKNKNVACSYRVEIGTDGSLFSNDSGWEDFQNKSKELSESGKYKFVLKLDITDFYNQVYHHRIENELEVANLAEIRRKNTLKFLSQITSKISRGIPIGPIGSNLLAEACMNDVDWFLIRKGFQHARYVDDFRIFCIEYDDAVKIWHDLTEYLYTSHRLSIQAGKTKIFDIEKFRNEELSDPQEIELISRSEKIRDFVNRINDFSIYSVHPEVVEAVHKVDIDEENFFELYALYMAQTPIQYKYVRHLLRRATSLGVVSILPLVTENLPNLFPLMRDVSKYMEKTLKGLELPLKRWHGEKLFEFLNENSMGKLPYCQNWGFWIISGNPEMIEYEKVCYLTEKSRADLLSRPSAMLAKSYKRIDWVRSQKENWKNNVSWDRRALIFSSQVLPNDEKEKWLRAIKKQTNDFLELLIIENLLMDN